MLTNTQPIIALLGILNGCVFKGGLSAAEDVPFNWEQ